MSIEHRSFWDGKKIIEEFAKRGVLRKHVNFLYSKQHLDMAARLGCKPEQLRRSNDGKAFYFSNDWSDTTNNPPVRYEI